MTRKHFETVAFALRLAEPIVGMEARLQWCRTVITIANELAATNPRFDAQRFKAACGMPTQEG